MRAGHAGRPCTQGRTEWAQRGRGGDGRRPGKGNARAASAPKAAPASDVPAAGAGATLSLLCLPACLLRWRKQCILSRNRTHRREGEVVR
jgi:hypothetical protein